MGPVPIQTRNGAPGQQPNNEKMRELMLYVAKQSDDDPALGKTKLNKLLFYCDMLSYVNLGSSITGYEYQRRDYGPCPPFWDLEQEMVSSGEFSWEDRVFFYPQRHPKANREPDITVFTEAELEVVNDVLSTFKTKTGRQMSDLSHTYEGWQLADDGETIPYATALMGDRELTQAEIAYAKRLEEEIPARQD